MSTATATAARLERVRAELASEGFDAIVVRNTTDLRWLTAFEYVFDEERAHCALVTQTAAMLHSDSRYDKALAARAEGTEWQVSGKQQRHSAYLVEAVTSCGAKRIAIEDDMPLCEWRAYVKAFADAGLSVELVETHDLILKLRAVKDAEELACHRTAQQITDDAFSHMCEWLRPGVTERDAQFELDTFLRKAGEGLAFPSICAAGENSANPHHVPGDTVAKTGDFFLMDFGGRWHDYDADMTRTVVFGEPSAKQREIYDVVRDANERCEAFIHAGVKGLDVHNLAQRILDEAGYGRYFGHGLGHGVGIDIHELPNEGSRSENILQAGSVVTVEPGIYLPGVGGVRLEDFGCVTDDGFEVFTQASHNLVVL
jgi:Xaa-Pro aminopeptidase